ncbi:unnamed protein product [Hymenolepis diminuta]|uniref:Uncharacterized protein n=1 Tax=Hymenolepis diminuta TaxID=6216 RepID=A0A0R3SLE0_HYMDI|nr:unnamed protein product [Hymenolepis diminuta]
MEARISSIVRNTFTQINFSTSTKDPKDCVKNVGMFHHNLLIGETFAAWYAQYRDSYESSIADLPYTTRISMLLRKVNRSDNDQNSTYLQLMDPAEKL